MREKEKGGLIDERGELRGISLPASGKKNKKRKAKNAPAKINCGNAYIFEDILILPVFLLFLRTLRGILFQSKRKLFLARCFGFRIGKYQDKYILRL